MSLPHDPKERKALPLARGLLDYFPDALAAVADVSRIGNEQHNPGQPIHWLKHLSTDHPDCLLRHLVDRGRRDTDGARHSAKVAWRALAMLQIEIEAEQHGMTSDEYIDALKAAHLPPARNDLDNRLAYAVPLCTVPDGTLVTEELLNDLYGAASHECVPSKAEPGEFDVVCRQPCRCDMG